MKKIRTLSLLAVGVTMASISLVGCNKKNSGNSAADLKVGLILLHPAASSTYDKNFRDGFEAAQKKLGFKAVIKENIGEDATCQEAAEEMAEQGCDIVFADSFGHEDYMIEAAKNNPNTLFCHATGVKAATVNLPNYFNAFASIYEGRYLAGVAAGLKLKALYGDDITDAEAKIGYVGAHPYAEVKSGYTSFFLGARSIVENATMDVVFTGSWYDEAKEKTAAEMLIAAGAKLISQHADSYGAPNACERAGIPNVSYNGSTAEQCPNTFLVSSRINWEPYYEYVINCKLNGEQVKKDYVGTFATGSVQLTELGEACAPGTAEKLEEVKAELIAGTRHVFDTSTFTVAHAEPSEANCAPSKIYTYDYPDGMEFVKGGYYHESEYRSAPSFDVDIDGINNLGNVPEE